MQSSPVNQAEVMTKQRRIPRAGWVVMGTPPSGALGDYFRSGHLQQTFRAAREPEPAEFAPAKGQTRVRRGGDQVVDDDATGMQALRQCEADGRAAGRPAPDRRGP